MKQYKVKFVVADATGYIHEITCGTIQAYSSYDALRLCETQFGKAENGAYYMIAGVN